MPRLSLIPQAQPLSPFPSLPLRKTEQNPNIIKILKNNIGRDFFFFPSPHPEWNMMSFYRRFRYVGFYFKATKGREARAIGYPVTFRCPRGETLPFANYTLTGEENY